MFLPSGIALLVDGSDHSLEVSGEGLAQTHMSLGRAAWSRPSSLDLVPLDPPMHHHTPERLHVVPEGGFKLDTIRFSDCGPVFPFCFGTHAC